jgi:hypothetical protein
LSLCGKRLESGYSERRRACPISLSSRFDEKCMSLSVPYGPLESQVAGRGVMAKAGAKEWQEVQYVVIPEDLLIGKWGACLGGGRYAKPNGASIINCWQSSCNSPTWYSLRLNLRSLVLASSRFTNHEESQLSQPALPRHQKEAASRPSFATASTRQDGERVVATSAKLVGRPSVQHAGHLIIESNTVAPRLMRSRLSALKASTSLPSLELRESPGIRFIAGWKKQPHGAADSMIEK